MRGWTPARSSPAASAERLERDAAARCACAKCGGKGLAAIRCEGEPAPWFLAARGPRGCPACGKVADYEIVVRFGDNPNGWWHARPGRDELAV